MKSLSIVGILVDKREKSAPRVQDVLTRHGDCILSRVGLHDPGEEQNGLITLIMRASRERINEMAKELESLDGVIVKTMEMK